ncbi:MAG: PD40 domain-containing protein [Planctomycetes bacterium]|nr:PD40 domain-containing protein [Planctomycetota bacterium]
MKKKRESPMSSFGKAFRLATIVITLVAAGGLAGMAYFVDSLPFGRAYTDGVAVVPATSDLHERVVVYEAPEPFLEEVWRARPITSRLAVHPAGDVLVYAAAGSRERSDLYWARLVDGRWSSQGPVVTLNRPESDEVTPAFANDGALFFASNRSEGEGYDLYVARFDGVRFQGLVRLGSGINSEHDELDPAFDERTNQLFFASNRPRQVWREEGEDFDLYRARGDAREPSGFAPAERLDALSSRANDRSPMMHPRGGRVVFASDRPGGQGGYDLYEATVSLADRTFLKPSAFDRVNGPLDERDPSFLDGGFRLLFRRSDPRVETVAEAVDDEPATVSAESLGHFQCRSRELERLPGKLTAVDLWTIAALLLLIGLMAYLAERWRALDLLYKAFLFSVFVHILLLLLSRRVDLVQEMEELPPRSPISTSFELAFAAQPDPTMEMWGGELPPRDQAPRDEVAIERANADPVEVDTPSPSEREAPSPLEREAFESAMPERSTEGTERNETSSQADVALAEPERPELESREGTRFEVESATEVERSEPRSEPNLERRTARAPATTASEATIRPVTAMELPERQERQALDPSRRTTEPRERTREVSLPEAVAMREPESLPSQPSNANESEAERERAMLGAAGEVTRTERSLAGNPSRSSARPLPRESLPSAGELTGEAVVIERRGRITSSPSRPERTPERVTAPSRSLPEAVAMRDPAADLPKSTPANGNAEGGSETGDLLAGLDAPSRTLPSADHSAATSRRSATPGDPFLEGLDRPTRRGEAPSITREARSGVGMLTRPNPALPEVPGRLAQPGTALASPSLPEAIAGPAHGADAGPSSKDLVADMAPRAFDRRSAFASRGADEATRGGRSGVRGPALPALENPMDRPVPVEVARADDPLRGRPGRPRRAVLPERYSRRQDVTLKEEALREGGGSRETERAVAAGLRYLAERQRSSGYWGDPRRPHEKYGYTLFGKTGLALLAFLGAGHTPRSGTEYSDVVSRGMKFLVRSQDDTGHFGNCAAYGHAIATYALCEAYAMERDDSLKQPLQAAVDWIVSRQKRDAPGTREFGGWSYYYKDDRTFDPYARASITAWQVMALESARIGGLDVSENVLEAARGFLKTAFDARTGTFRYSHDPARLRSIYPTLPGSTPASLFVLRIQGEDVEGPLYQGAWKFLNDRRPVDFQRHSDMDFVKEGAGNLYFWYYSTLAMFQKGGSDWDLWNTALKRVLLPAQDENGSWRPISPYAETAGDTNEDRVYTSAMCVLMLEVYYRYFTPLLDKR